MQIKSLTYTLILLCTIIFFSCSRSGRKIKHDQYSATKESKRNPEVTKEISPPKILPESTEQEEKARPATANSNPSLEELYPILSKSVFTIYNSDGSQDYQGSGFFVHSSGIAVSNYHVFKDKLRGKSLIVMKDGSQYQVGEVLEKNEEYDYIIFKVPDNSKSFPHLEIGTAYPHIGEEVFAIGNPKGLQSTLSNGIISGIRDINPGDNAYIQINAEITHGSSGGALFNKYGEVIGITTSGLDEANLNFAIDIQILNLNRFLRSK